MPMHMGGLRHRKGCSKRLHIANVNPLDLAWGTSINIDAQVHCHAPVHAVETNRLRSLKTR